MTIFSIYFGAGNFILPMGLGINTMNNSIILSSLGFFITAILMPSIGLIAILSFNGNYKTFLSTIGKWPGFILTIILIAFIGPIGAMPRCVSFAFSTLKSKIPYLTSNQFCFIICLLVFIFAFKKSNIITILGKILTPFLLISLLTIIIISFTTTPECITINNTNNIQAFLLGFKTGPSTMDLFASFFFASIIIPSFQNILKQKNIYKNKSFLPLIIICCSIGLGLLTIVYIGLISISFMHRGIINSAEDKIQWLNILSDNTLGNNGSFISGIAIFLACLTTAIALAIVFSEFVEKEIFSNKIPYALILFITMTITFYFAKIGFTALILRLEPWLFMLYPMMFTLTICNLAKKYLNFTWIKTPVYIIGLLSIINRFI